MALVVGAAGMAGPAQAADDGVAETHIKNGIELRRRGDDQAALGEFTKAYDLARTPRAAAQLALCEQSLARWVEAHGHMLEALAHKDDPWISKNRNTLQPAFAAIREHTARLEVVGSPDGAELSVAGRSIGRLPMSGPVMVNAGLIDLEVTAPGYKRVQRSFTLPADGYQRVLIRLDELAAAGPVAALPRAPDPEPPTGAPATGLVAPQPAATNADDGHTDDGHGAAPIYARPWFWVAVGVVVAAGVAGTLIATRGTQYPSGEIRTLP